MSLNPTGTTNYNWNYSKQDREDYSPELIGTVVSLQEVQARDFSMNGQPGRPKFWPDGNPVMNIRMGVAQQDGTLKSVTFAKAGKKQRSGEKPSLHMQLFNLTNGNMLELIGKTVHLATWAAHPSTGQAWGQGNPRLFVVEEIDNPTPYELSAPLPEEFKVPELFANDAVSGGQPVPAQPAQIQVPNAQYQQPMAQPMQPMQPMQQMQPMQPVQQMQPMQPVQQVQPMQPVYQPQPASVNTAQMPAGMDPAVAQAMQAVGAVNVQPYDDELPI